MGNICRSPTAQGVFRKLIEDEEMTDQIEIDSAGTHAYHVGHEPDQRAQECALRRGIDISSLRGRRVDDQDFETFDYILAMDRENFEDLRMHSPEHHEHKIRLFLDYAPHLKTSEVPDPYYGGNRGFDKVIDMVEQASIGLLESIIKEKDL